MTSPFRLGMAAAVAAAVALPAAATGQGHGHHGGNLPARVKHRVQRVDHALNGALDAIDAGDDATAIAKLGAVDKNLAKALKAANHQADGAKGPASLGAVAGVADEVATSTADALDGAGQSLSDALVASMDGALDERDAIVATITALADDSGYDRTLGRIAADSGDEVDAFTEGVADDELVDSAKAAETDAATQAGATQTAAQAGADAIDGGAAGDDGPPLGDGAGGDCPPGGHGGHGGPHGPPGGPTGPTGPTGPAGSQGPPS